MTRSITLALALSALPGVAQADRVTLGSGAVIEGTAEVFPDKVVVTLESGAITLPRGSVERIERERAPLDVVTERRAKLAASDLQGRLALARYCRQHGLASTERELWLEVLALAPDQPEAHARLGHVRTKDGYVDAVVVEKERRAEREADTRAAREARERVELASERARLDRERAELALREERLRGDAYAQRASTPAQPSVFIPYAFAPRGLPQGVSQGAAPSPPFTINGVRSPHESMNFSLPGVRAPSSYFGP